MSTTAAAPHVGHAHRHRHVHHQRRRRGDPTRTKTIRRRHASHIRGLFDKLKRHINVGIVQNDAAGLGTPDGSVPVDSLTLAANIDIDDSLTPGAGQFAFARDADTLEAFDDWLDEVLDQEILFQYEGDDFLRQGAGRGIKHADGELRRAGVDPGDQSVTAVLRQPVHRDKLELVATRAFEELDGITDATAQQLRREMADGLSQGIGPREMGRRMGANIEDIKANRATVLAHTETIRAHSEFTLDRYEQIAGDIEVTIVAELSTAGDSRVCDICLGLEGTRRTITEVRNGTFTPSGYENRARSEFPIQPPIHPLCRCVIIPFIRN